MTTQSEKINTPNLKINVTIEEHLQLNNQRFHNQPSKSYSDISSAIRENYSWLIKFKRHYSNMYWNCLINKGVLLFSGSVLLMTMEMICWTKLLLAVKQFYAFSYLSIIDNCIVNQYFCNLIKTYCDKKTSAILCLIAGQNLSLPYEYFE